MLYTAVVGADAGIGPYRQGLSPTRFAGVSSQRGVFPQLQNFLNHLAKSFRVGYNRNIRKPIPCPNYGQHIIKV